MSLTEAPPPLTSPRNVARTNASNKTPRRDNHYTQAAATQTASAHAPNANNSHAATTPRDATSRPKRPLFLQSNNRGARLSKDGILVSRSKKSAEQDNVREPLCASSLRSFVERGTSVCVVSFCTLGYTAVICATGPIPRGYEEGIALQVTAIICIIAWTGEVALKLGGYGVWAYIKQPWNLLDLICTVSLYVDLVGVSGTSFAYLRILRILQPLRRWRHFQTAYRMIEIVLTSMANLPPVASLIFIFILLMALVGRNIFGSSGTLRNRCVWEATRETVLPEAHCANESWTFAYACGSGQECVHFTDADPFDAGVVTFDDAGGAVLATAMVMLREDFSNILFAAVDTTGQVCVCVHVRMYECTCVCVCRCVCVCVCYMSFVHANGCLVS
jgi:hypothetical protein